jgi:predicted transcriptional regulator
MQKTCSQQELAELLGVSGAAVSKAIKSGRLQKSIEKIGSEYKIFIQEAIREWYENRDITKSRNQMDDVSYAEAKRLQVLCNIKLMELEYEQKASILVYRASVQGDFDEIANELREKLSSLPYELSPSLVNLQDEKLIQTIIQEKIEKYCDELSSRNVEPPVA